MSNWQSLPEPLRLPDGVLEKLTLQDIVNLFKYAEEMGVTDTFTKLFWNAMMRVRANSKRVSIQMCVDLLEERKRTLGRAINYKHNSPIAKLFFSIRYNECEYNIRWLVEQYECNRKTKPTLLKIKNDTF